MSLSRLKRLLRLPRTERRLLFSALSWLPLTGLCLRVVGLRRTFGWMRRRASVRSAVEGDGPTQDQVRATARMVARACRAMPYRVGCLRSALVLWWLLARRGVACRLLIGVGKPETGFEAHAWVEWGDMVLNDDDGVRERFVPVAWQMADGARYAEK
jgi:hypothetical protein